MLLAAVSGTGLLAVAGIGAAIGLVVFAIASRAEERSVVRASLRQIDGYDVDVRDQELSNPLRERAIVPTLEKLSELGRRFQPAGYADQVRQKFVYAGDASAEAVDRFLATQVLCVVGGVL